MGLVLRVALSKMLDPILNTSHVNIYLLHLIKQDPLNIIENHNSVMWD